MDLAARPTTADIPEADRDQLPHQRLWERFVNWKLGTQDSALGLKPEGCRDLPLASGAYRCRPRFSRVASIPRTSPSSSASTVTST